MNMENNPSHKMDKNQQQQGFQFGTGNTTPEECWEIYQKVMEETKTLDDYLDEECSPRSYVEGEEEAEWLRAAGLGELTEAWKAGREVQAEELGAALRPLSRTQAEAVKRRVRSLNCTVKQRFNQRQRARKPHVRNVFQDSEASSTGTRSRSATPDSLDSISGETLESASPPSPPSTNAIDATSHETDNVSSLLSIFHRNVNENKEAVRRIPSVPLANSNSASNHPSFSEIFRRSSYRWPRGDVASDSEGIQLTAYQRLGTIRTTRRSGSDPSEVAKVEPTVKLAVPADTTLRRSSDGHATVTRSHSSLYCLRGNDENTITRPLNRTSSHGHLSFEEMFKANDTKVEQQQMKQQQAWVASANEEITLDDYHLGQSIEMFSQRDLTRLQPLLWLELTAVFDRYNIPLVRRKPNKRRRKAGNVFGASLSTLLLRDNQLTGDESNIPLIFRKILEELTKRGVKEEGILRVGGHKQKVEMLCSELEQDFYRKQTEMENLLARTPCHDLANILKKLVRDLPQPLLTVELIDAFYQSHGVKNKSELARSLNLLVLLLPVEHRCTLKALLEFLKLVVENESCNKMSIHNVSMIVAPSLYPPRYIYPRDRTDLSAQVNMAAVCCQVTEALLLNTERLWYVPSQLIQQLRRHNEEERYKKHRKKYY